MLKKNSIILIYIIFSLFLFPNICYSQYHFIQNKGQLPNKVLAKNDFNGGSLFIEKGRFVFAFFNQNQLNDIHSNTKPHNFIQAHSYSLEFLNSNINSVIKFSGKSDYFENFYSGNVFVDSAYLFSNVLQKNIYEGIDLLLYKKSTLKYDLILKPFANYKKIKIKYKGQDNISLINNNLVITNSFNTTTELSPYAYQLIGGDTLKIECLFNLHKNVVTYSFPQGYNKSYQLIIDPELIFSTYSGSTSNNFGFSATYDNDGFLYSGGIAFGLGYPTTLGSFQVNYAGGGVDISITKYDTTGTLRIYSTYLGGNSSEFPHSMIVGKNDELFILGTTGSSDFPVSTNAFDTVFSGGPLYAPAGIASSFPNGSDIFVSKLSANGGNLLSSTYLGGTENDGLNISTELKYNYADDFRGEIDIDLNGNIYIATSTYSADFPVTNNVFQPYHSGEQEGCIIKMDNQLNTIIWSSFLGGVKDDGIYSLALDKNDNIYVTGGTFSKDFFSNLNSYKPFLSDTTFAEAFIVSISSDGKSIINATYYGSTFYDQSYFIEISEDNLIYITGQTKSIGDSLIYNANYFKYSGGQFIAVFDTSLSSLVRSTVIGSGKGTPDISPSAFLVDKCGNIYISGWGANLGGSLSTLNLDVTNNAFQDQTDGNDFYLIVINNNLDSLIYATYFGGSQSSEHVDGGTSRFDKSGVIYQSVCAGCNNNDDFPIFPNPGAVSVNNPSSFCNNGVFKFNFQEPVLIADFQTPLVSCGTTISLINSSNYLNQSTFSWYFGDGVTSNDISPTHTYSSPGQYTITLVANSTYSCNSYDTVSYDILILSDSSFILPSLEKCEYSNLQIGILPFNDPGLSYLWTPSGFLNDSTISNPVTSTNDSTNYSLIISYGSCTDTINQVVNISEINFELFQDTSYCQDSITLLKSIDSNLMLTYWSSNYLFEDTLSLSPFFYVFSPGTFYFKAYNNGCVKKDSIIVLADEINISLFSDSASCLNDTINISCTNLTVSPILQYSWTSYTLIDFSNDSSSISVIAEDSAWHFVEVINTKGCILKDSINTFSAPTPFIDSLWLSSYFIFTGETSTLNILTNDSFIWFNGSSNTNQIISPDYSDWFTVTVFNQSCIIFDSIFLQVNDILCNNDSLIVPSAFTPNGDGFNDFYYVLNNGVDLLSFDLEVFNRLGQKVFQTNDITDKWNGSYKGKPLLPQVLDYFLKIKCFDNNELFKKGNITLLK
tara:strand:+ start:5128 stop:8802 length:3675 start_codon:yes stop_codon:yes gene_type:complete